MLAKLFAKFFAGEHFAAQDMDLQLLALVPDNGPVRLVRQGVSEQHISNVSRFRMRPLHIQVLTLSGAYMAQTVWGDGRQSIESVTATLREEYDIVEIEGFKLFNKAVHFLELCFEDLADDTDTLQITVLKCNPEIKKRKTAAPTETLTDKDNDAILERVWKTYQEELHAPILMPLEIQEEAVEPFKVGDVMTNTLDLMIRWNNNKNFAKCLNDKMTVEWALVNLPSALTILSSGSDQEWRTLKARKSSAGNLVCLESKGHDSNPTTFKLAIHIRDASGFPVLPRPIVEEPMIFDEAWQLLEMTGLRQMIERCLAGYGEKQDMMYSVDMKKENMTLRPLYKVVLGKYVILTAVAQCRRPPCRECCNPLPMV